MATKYYKRSNLTDIQFESMLSAFIKGTPASQIEKDFQRKYNCHTRYEDTINRTLKRVRNSIGRYFGTDNSILNMFSELNSYLEEIHGQSLKKKASYRELSRDELKKYSNVFIVNLNHKGRCYGIHLKIRDTDLKTLLNNLEKGIPPILSTLSLIGFHKNRELELLYSSGIEVNKFIEYSNEILSQYHGIPFSSQAGYFYECAFKHNHINKVKRRRIKAYDFLVGHFLNRPIGGKTK